MIRPQLAAKHLISKICFLELANGHTIRLAHMEDHFDSFYGANWIKTKENHESLVVVQFTTTESFQRLPPRLG